MSKALTFAKPSPNGSHKQAAASPGSKLESLADYLAANDDRGKLATIERCLSIRQPWAFAIVKGWKPVENRTWSTNYRGFVAIHASGRLSALSESAFAYVENAAPYMVEAMAEKNFPVDPKTGKRYNPITVGNIIGIAEIVGVVPFKGKDFLAACEKAEFAGWWESQYNFTAVAPDYWAEPAGYCWLLDNGRMLAEPIPADGKLNLWRLSAEQVVAVMAAKLLPAFECPEKYRDSV